MDVTQLDPPRTQADFANALQQLLPPGDYWHPQQESPELTQMLNGLGAELKTVHDETKLSFLFAIDNSLMGWKLADFQALLDSGNLNSTVYDNAQTPNLIYIKFEQQDNAGALMQTLEEHRLPHTKLNWQAQNRAKLHTASATKNMAIDRAQKSFNLTQKSPGVVSVLTGNKNTIINRTNMRTN